MLKNKKKTKKILKLEITSDIAIGSEAERRYWWVRLSRNTTDAASTAICIKISNSNKKEKLVTYELNKGKKICSRGERGTRDWREREQRINGSMRAEIEEFCWSILDMERGRGDSRPAGVLFVWGKMEIGKWIRDEMSERETYIQPVERRRLGWFRFY